MEKKQVKKGIIALIVAIGFAVAAYFGVNLPFTEEQVTDTVCSDANPVIDCVEPNEAPVE